MNKPKFDAADAIAVDAINGAARFTIITSTNPDTLTKQYILENRRLAKRGRAGLLVEGRAVVASVDTLQDFAEILTSLEHNQALTFGTPPRSDIDLTTREEWEAAGRPDDRVPRTNDVFSWPDGPGILMLDYDPESEGQALSREKLVDITRAAVPGLRDVEFLWRPSASSMIKNAATGELLSGLRGQRLYFMVADASDIPRAGRALADHLWLHGHGHVMVSKSGRLLERALFDTSVWQACRIDLACGAKCEAPLAQDRGHPVIIPGRHKIADTRKLIPSLNSSQAAALSAIKDAAKAEKQEEAEAARAAWEAERVDEMVLEDASDEECKRARATARRALDAGELMGDFVLHLVRDGQTIQMRVSEVLSAAEKHHGALTLDPLEPDYDGGRIVGKIFTNSNTPVLHSFAHGEKTYRLLPKVHCIEIYSGRLAEAVDKTLDCLRTDPKIFDYGEDLVIVENGSLYRLDEHALAQHLGGRIQYIGYRSNGERYEREPPPNLCKRILSKRSRRDLKKLKIITTAPTLRLDGSLLVEPGFDAATGIYYWMLPGSAPPYVPEQPTLAQVSDALRTVMHPFDEFPFVQPCDRGVLLAAILTAAVRASLPTAPAFGFDAPTKGSGKTLLAKCIAVLCGAEEPSVYAPTDKKNDDEMRKRVLAHLRTGAPYFIIDNVRGAFNSDTLAALLTSDTFSDRVLTRSEILELPNKTMVMLTSNNLDLAEDMIRRFLVCRIDPRMERPFDRNFDLSPMSHVRTHRLDLIAAALTLIRGQLTADQADEPSQLGSFEDWNRLVRKTVLWVGRHVVEGYGDPADSISRSLENDPEAEVLENLLCSLEMLFGNEQFMSKDLLCALRFDKTFQLVKKHSTMELQELRMNCREVFDAISTDTQWAAHSVTQVLKYRVDRPIGGLVLRRSRDKHKKVVLWRVERL